MGKVIVLDGPGNFTPEQSLLQAMERIESFDQVVWMAVDKDGLTITGWSKGSNLHILGMLELTRADVIERMRVNKRLDD